MINLWWRSFTTELGYFLNLVWAFNHITPFIIIKYIIILPTQRSSQNKGDFVPFDKRTQLDCCSLEENVITFENWIGGRVSCTQQIGIAMVSLTSH